MRPQSNYLPTIKRDDAENFIEANKMQFQASNPELADIKKGIYKNEEEKKSSNPSEE